MFCNINHHIIVSFKVSDNVSKTLIAIAIRVFETLSLICTLMHLSIYNCFKFNKLRCFKTLKVQFKNTNEINNSVDIAESRYVQRCDYLFYKVIIICVRLRASWSYITWFQIAQRPMLTLRKVDMYRAVAKGAAGAALAAPLFCQL